MLVKTNYRKKLTVNDQAGCVRVFSCSVTSHASVVPSVLRPQVGDGQRGTERVHLRYDDTPGPGSTLSQFKVIFEPLEPVNKIAELNKANVSLRTHLAS